MSDKTYPTSPDVDDAVAGSTGSNVVLLIPHPSSDSRDPLNWPMSRKVLIVATLCFATFAGVAGSLAAQLIPKEQSKLYGVSTTKIAYQTSAANGGQVVGALVLFPLSYKFGRSSVILWSLVGSLATQIWSAEMTGKNDFGAYLASRGMSGFFGTTAAVLGPRVLFDLFFLHQRGRFFTYFYWAVDFGTVAGPTLGAFIGSASGANWTDAFWWSAGLAGVAVIMMFLFVQETHWNREDEAENEFYVTPSGFVASRVATYFPGTKVTPRVSALEVLKVAANPFLIAFSPPMLVLAVFTLLSFGFYIAMNSITPVWLQTPVKEGGYGFTARENALFSFTHWVGIVIALIYGHLVSDRLPLWLCARQGGVWKPEYRLYALIFPALISNPIGLGIFGATLQYHWSWGVLAWGQVMVTFGSLAITPITTNYACEIFNKNPAETAIVMNIFRISFGISVAFYITPWVQDMSFNWTYGLMAFLQVGSFFAVILLMWKGHEIRKLGTRMVSDEDGARVVEEKEKM